MTYDPPARLSIEDDDFSPELGRRLAVLLDGKPIGKVVAYDLGSGTVTFYPTDKHGDCIIEGDSLKRTTSHGRVSVIWCER